MPFKILKKHLENGLVKQDIIDQINNSGETKLNIYGMVIKQLPSFRYIKELKIEESVINEIPSMPMLKELYISTSSTEYIHNSPNLEVLTVIDSYNLFDYPEVDLKKLTIIQSDVSRIPRYRNLVELTIKEAILFREIPQLDSLVILNLQEIPRLEKIPLLNNLKELNISSLERLVELPSLPNLKKLKIEYDTRLVSLPYFPRLDHLVLFSSDISTLPPEETPLVVLSICDVPHIKIIPDYPTLQKLVALHCNNVTRVPYLPALVKMDSGASSLEDIGIVDIETYRKWKYMADVQIRAVASMSRKKNLGPDISGKHGLGKYLNQ